MGEVFKGAELSKVAGGDRRRECNKYRKLGDVS